MAVALAMPPETGCRRIVITAGKGGVGRSTVARGLLIAAGQQDVAATVLDLDPQRTVLKWAAKRDATRKAMPEFAEAHVVASDLDGWRRESTGLARVAIFDTAPVVEHDLPRVIALAQAGDLVLVPTSTSPDDLDSTIPWMATLLDRKCKAVFVMNKVQRATRGFTKARSKLLKVGPVAPVEVPLAEDIAQHCLHGLTVLDIRGSRGRDSFIDLWTWASREIRL